MFLMFRNLSQQEIILLAFNRQDFFLCQDRESFFTVTNQSFVAAFEGNFFPVSVFAREQDQGLTNYDDQGYDKFSDCSVVSVAVCSKECR